MKAKLYVLVGMVASGKSTYCKNAARSGHIIVNDDAIVNMLHAYDYTLYDKRLKLLYKSIENQIIAMTLAMNRVVVIDRGLNISIQGRKRWLALSSSFDIPCEAIVFKHDGVETHARRRAESDVRGHDYEYWLAVATCHNDRYSEPSLDEGFDAVHHITFEEINEGRYIV